MTNKSIKVEGLEKFYGDLKAVDGLSFEVNQGMIFGMLGPNGAGKTTTIETLIGLTNRSGGNIEILGLDPAEELDKLKKRIGFQLQSPALFARLSVKELLDLFASFYRNPLAVEKVIEMVGLESKANDRTNKLSGGQFHRLAVALAIVSNGDVIFLDEPTTGLDPQSRRKLWDTILKLKDMGKTIFLTTHYMDEAETLCDDLLIIDNGKAIAKGSPNELIDQYFGGKTIEFIDPNFKEEDRIGLKNLDGVTQMDYSNEKKNIILYTENYSSTIMELLGYAKNLEKNIENLQFRRPTLEDLFLKITGRGIE